MNLKRVDDPCFSLREAAMVARVDEGTLRGWHRSGFAAWVGKKRGHFLQYSAREIAAIAIAADLVRMRWPPSLAIRAACVILHETPSPDVVLRGTPDAILNRHFPGGYHTREVVAVPHLGAATIVLPVGAIWSRVMGECAALYERAAA